LRLIGGWTELDHDDHELLPPAPLAFGLGRCAFGLAHSGAYVLKHTVGGHHGEQPTSASDCGRPENDKAARSSPDAPDQLAIAGDNPKRAETCALRKTVCPGDLRAFECEEGVAARPRRSPSCPPSTTSWSAGLRLHYLDWGRRDRPALLFLHGGALTAHTWDLVCLALRADFHCLAVDLRGHGDSEWSPNLDYGRDRRVSDFVLRDPGRGSLHDFVRRARAFNPRRDPRLLRYSLLHNLRPLAGREWTWKYDRRGLTAEYFASVTQSLERLQDVVQAVTCPVLVVRGAESDSFSDTDAARFAAALPDGRWARVEDAGHTVQGDNPRGLVQVLTRFFAEIGHSRSPTGTGPAMASPDSRARRGTRRSASDGDRLQSG